MSLRSHRPCMKSLFFPIQGKEIHVRTWGDSSHPPLLCWHGVSRNGGDFGFLANHIADRYYVIAPDTTGRGLSSWEKDPEEYKIESYISLIVELVKVLELKEFAWLGTSMGGTLGFLLASTHLQKQICKLILNDIGPILLSKPLHRIGAYLGQKMRFETLSELKAHLKKMHFPFGPLSESQWEEMAIYSARKLEDGAWTHHYDTRIADNFAKLNQDLDLFPFYDQVKCSTLLIRGKFSDLMTRELAENMSQRGPKPECWVIEDAGHAPMLHRPEEAETIIEFLEK